MSINRRTKEYSGSFPTTGLPRVCIRTSFTLLPEEKFKIAAQDSFDRGTVALAVLFAGEGQLANSTPAFGQGVLNRVMRDTWEHTCGFRDRGHDDGCRLSCYASSRPALVISGAVTGTVWSRPRECGRPDFLDPHGFWEYAVQLFGDCRQLNCSGDFDRLLSR